MRKPLTLDKAIDIARSNEITNNQLGVYEIQHYPTSNNVDWRRFKLVMMSLISREEDKTKIVERRDCIRGALEKLWQYLKFPLELNKVKQSMLYF